MDRVVHVGYVDRVERDLHLEDFAAAADIEQEVVAAKRPGGDDAGQAGARRHRDGVGSHGQRSAGEPIGDVPPQEPGDERSAGPLPHVGRGAHLLDAALVHDHQAIGERERLVVVVGDEQDGEAEPYEEGTQLGDEAFAQGTVEGTERLVEHQEARRSRERAGQRDALLFAAGKLRDPAVFESGHADERERVPRSGLDLGAWDALHAEPERDVADDIAMGKQRVVLEHEPEPAPVRGHVGEVGIVPRHSTARVGLETGDRAQQ